MGRSTRRRIRIILSLFFILTLLCTSLPIIASAQMPGCTPNFTAQPMVSAGDNHSVYLKNDGTVWTWGENNFGQLGNGTTADSSPPVQVTGLCDAIAVSAGLANAAALKSDGTVWMWGNNAFGQLGNGTTGSSPVPVQVSNLTDVAAIAAGAYYTVALKKDGTVWTWGYNASGQLGYDTAGSNSSYVPRQVNTLSGIASIAAGFNHAAAVSSTGGVWTWGDNAYSQLGRATGTNSYQSAPAQVSGLSEVRSVSLGLNFSVALLQDGTVWAWGYNGLGQLGNGTRTTANSPEQVLAAANPRTELNNVVSIKAGTEHTIALLSDGTLQAWGSNAVRQIGDGTTAGWRLVAAKVNLSGAAVSMAAGRGHSMAVQNDGTVWTWGENAKYQLGRKTPAQGTVYGPSDTPGQVFEGLVDCTAATSFRTKPMIAAGGKHSAALKSNGTVWTWGNNEYGQLGNGTYGDKVAPAQVPDLCYVKAIATGSDFTLALKNDGTVWAWGNNANGELGSGTGGTNNRSPVPVQVEGISDVIAIAAGSNHTLAVKRDGTVWAWGNSENSKLGYETPGSFFSSRPGRAGSLIGVKAVTAGLDFSAALKPDGSVWTWGKNTDKQLGYETGTPLNNPVPRQVPNLNNVDVLTTGSASRHILALKRDGSVWAWGDNVHGQLGNGRGGLSADDSSVPIRVLTANNNAGLEGVTSIGAGTFQSYAALKNGTLRGWGYNYFGHLGDGTFELEYKTAQRLLMKSVVSISASTDHTLAIKRDGTVWSWGSLNTSYQLGRKSGAPFIENNVPGPVEGLGSLEVFTLIPYIPINVGIIGTIGALTDDTPVAARGAEITITAFFDNPKAVKVTLIASDAGGRRYEAQMSTIDDENWSHTFTPDQVGLVTSPLAFEIIPHYSNNGIGPSIKYGMALIDPSGIIYNANQGGYEIWPFPGATVILQYYDPELGEKGQWADMNEAQYEGRFKPVTNPQITGEDGRFAWDTAAGQYRVVVSRPGFEPATSRIVSVPPPVLDLHVGLVPIDTLKPTLSVSGVTSGENYTQPVAIEWHASDDHPDHESDDPSGVRFVKHRLGDGKTVIVNGSSGSFAVDEPGTHTVHFTVVDHAGNEYTESIPFTIADPGEDSHTVTFNSNGGSPIGSLTVNDGTAASKPADPVRAGYRFAGWYSDSELTKLFDFAAPITRDLTLYAKWTAVSSIDLSALVVSNSVLSPSFSANTTSYTANVGSSISSMTVYDGDRVRL
ncbi:RCC1 domain-containing protein [Paenibacillus spongiae]|uniref:InlB B-repeat-containing protein n=1 Tax=Paenibacillus spongiae TaxID=2909671 RepID=A0ABY5SG54_9BACL|nr:InlB B-repeat-containing protein [Paenibacillus spongiae]UVI32926.1 InlB B-repeat-containing protein [Paenibacillus spongiae]